MKQVSKEETQEGKLNPLFTLLSAQTLCLRGHANRCCGGSNLRKLAFQVVPGCKLDHGAVERLCAKRWENLVVLVVYFRTQAVSQSFLIHLTSKRFSRVSIY